MYSETVVMFILLAGVLIGIMLSVTVNALKEKTYQRWQRGMMWYVVDEKGNLIRAQFEHPSQAVEDAKRILKVSRGDKIDNNV